MEVLHGGDLQQASQRFNVPVEQWIDLSTGINPDPYAINQLDLSAYHQLPYLKPAFIQAAQNYYLGKHNSQVTSDHLLAVSGSQAVIQLLPQCLPAFPVIVPELGYQEHRLQWQKAGAKLVDYPSIDHDASVSSINQLLEHNHQQHLVIINPNNPSGLLFSPEQIQKWAQKLGEGAYVIIDEAFIDTQPEMSVLKQHYEENMVVLRSFGKFFGLAGLRLGFVFANETLIHTLQGRLGLWAINGPAQSIATTVFKDEKWQQQARIDINEAAKVNKKLFSALFNSLQNNQILVSTVAHEALFSSYCLPIGEAKKLVEFFAYRGILLRLIEFNGECALVRIGRINVHHSKAVQSVREAIDSYIAQIKA